MCTCCLGVGCFICLLSLVGIQCCSSLIFPCYLLTGCFIHYGNWGIEISDYCSTFYFSVQLYAFSLHVIWGYIIIFSNFKESVSSDLPTYSCLNYFIILFIFPVDSAGSLLLPGIFSSCGEQGLLQLWCTEFSLQCLLSWSTDFRGCGFSSCGSWALRHRPSSCGARALLLCSMWDLPGSGIKPISPALAGKFFTTEPPGKPSMSKFL